MLNSIEVLCHSAIKFNKDKIIYVDPFKINNDFKDADLIFITHNHYDHYSEEDILRVKKKDTKIIITKDIYDNAKQLGFTKEQIKVVEVDKEYDIEGIKFKTIPSYNITKQFHPKTNMWIGYIIEIEGVKYYIAGDTDITEENKKVQCDVAFVPVGGTYTMDYKEAAELINIIKPKIAVPTHYGSIVGEKTDGLEFKKLVDKDIGCIVMI